MQNLGDRRIDDYITFGVQLHRFSSGAVYAPTGSVTYTFYENNSTSGAPTGGNLAQLNSKTGLYSTRVQLTTAAGFEAGKDYFVHVEATVDSVAAGELFSFRVVDVPTVDVTKLGGDAQSATDLKDFADAGYDPSTNKVQGVATVDTVTTYTGNTPQTGDAYARLGANGAGLTALGDTRLANLDAAVSSRSTYAGGDTSGTTTLLSRLSSARAGYLDNLSAGAVALETSLQALITTIGASAAGVASAVWSAATRVLTAATNLAIPSAADNRTEMDSNSTKLAAIVEDTGTTLQNDITAIKGATFDGSTDSLEALRNRGDAAWGTATGFSTHTAADVWAVGTRTLTSFGTLVSDIATAVWAAGTRTLTALGFSLPWNSDWDAEVQSEVQDAIEANHLDHLLAASYNPASKPGNADALLNKIVESDAGVPRFTENSLEMAPAGGGGGGGGAEWDDLIADHEVAGSFGEAIQTILLRVLTPSGTTQQVNLESGLLDEVAREQSTFIFTVNFRDHDGAAVIPETASWTLTDGLGAVINSRSNVAIASPSASEEIVLSGSDLQKTTDRAQELRIFTLKWTYGGGKTAKEECRFYVKELAGI